MACEEIPLIKLELNIETAYGISGEKASVSLKPGGGERPSGAHWKPMRAVLSHDHLVLVLGGRRSRMLNVLQCTGQSPTPFLALEISPNASSFLHRPAEKLAGHSSGTPATASLLRS